jgi:hypothetical protein
VTVLANTPVSSVLFWVAVLIALLLAGAMGVFALRRSILGDRGGVPDHGGLMEQMRRMVDRGEMTQEEFDLARRTIVEKARAQRPDAAERRPDR